MSSKHRGANVFQGRHFSEPSVNPMGMRTGIARSTPTADGMFGVPSSKNHVAGGLMTGQEIYAGKGRMPRSRPKM